jgi:hypothetical protein
MWLKASWRTAVRKWLSFLRLRIWCSFDGHGGIMPLDGGHEFKRGGHALCKRCGATLKLFG